MGDTTPSPNRTSSRPMTPTTPPRLFLTSAARKSAAIEVMQPRTPSPPPADSQPLPLRFPETFGDLIEVREAEGKGLGVFALRDILPGTVLLSEAPLVTLKDNGSRADPLDASVTALSPRGRKAFLALSHFSRNTNESVHRSIVYSNGYSIVDDMATGVFETASRINHSCVPNSHYIWKDSIGRMIFWNRFKLLEGEEVTVNYGHKKGQLKRIYGFDCQCGGCTDWGSVDSSSKSSSDYGDRENQMRSLDAMLKGDGVTTAPEKEELDELAAKTEAITLEAADKS